MQGLRPIISAYTRPRSVVAFIGALQQAFDLGVQVFPVFFGDLRRTGAEKGIAVDGYRLLDNIANDQTCIRTLRSIPLINDICFLIPKIKSGGRVVASSNLVTPTNRESLIFSRISRIFLLCYIAGKMAVVHKWNINGRHPKISISVVKYLDVGRLLYLGLYSCSKQGDNEFYRVSDYMNCNRIAASSVGI